MANEETKPVPPYLLMGNWSRDKAVISKFGGTVTDNGSGSSNGNSLTNDSPINFNSKNREWLQYLAAYTAYFKLLGRTLHCWAHLRSFKEAVGAYTSQAEEGFVHRIFGGYVEYTIDHGLIGRTRDEGNDGSTSKLTCHQFLREILGNGITTDNDVYAISYFYLILKEGYDDTKPIGVCFPGPGYNSYRTDDATHLYNLAYTAGREYLNSVMANRSSTAISLLPDMDNVVLTSYDNKWIRISDSGKYIDHYAWSAYGCVNTKLRARNLLIVYILANFYKGFIDASVAEHSFGTFTNRVVLRYTDAEDKQRWVEACKAIASYNPLVDKTNKVVTTTKCEIMYTSMTPELRTIFTNWFKYIAMSDIVQATQGNYFGLAINESIGFVSWYWNQRYLLLRGEESGVGTYKTYSAAMETLVYKVKAGLNLDTISEDKLFNLFEQLYPLKSVNGWYRNPEFLGNCVIIRTWVPKSHSRTDPLETLQKDFKIVGTTGKLLTKYIDKSSIGPNKTNDGSW